MVQRTAKYQPRRVNGYVPNMAYHAGVVHAAPYEVVFGPVAVAAAASILSAQSIAVAGSTTTFLQDNTDPVVAATQALYPYGPGFGRNLQYVASGAAVSTVTVAGRDYLGQRMTETITLNGATPVVGNKAFKWIDTITWGATAATTINVGTGSKLGVPFRVMNVLAEMSNKQRVATLGTLANPDTTDPQTALTGDTRGTYIPNTTPDGTKVLSAIFLLDNSNNANGNGGLHGLQQA
jgi:hypothetical protein